jgi:hypothetical protein
MTMDDPGFEALCRRYYGDVVRTAYLIIGSGRFDGSPGALFS